MTYYIGIDGGGTKTEAVIANECGQILARHVGTTSNPNDITPEGSLQVLSSLVSALMADVGLHATGEEQISLFVGVAGGINHGPLLERELKKEFPMMAAVSVRSDVHILLSGELPMGDGACIICGTGSACFLRRGSEVIRIGGWGYLLDSGGSGYDIGRDALEAALRAYDGRGEATLLTELLTAHLGGEVQTRITEIYREGKPYIASCAPLVFKAAENGDRVAEEILQRNARKLAEYVEAAWKWETATDSLPPARFPVVMGGGISVKAAPLWQNRIASLIKHSDIPLELKVATMPPVFGAVVEAVKQMNEGSIPDLLSLRDRFLEEYSVIAST
ncbi:MAG: hypothetical protein IKU90_04080 [Clostridia bacterium]|nr:hypothetical protein [Clostridia bacterium]